MTDRADVTTGLTPDQQAMLELERRRPGHDGDKTREISERFDLTSAEYERLLARVLELPSAAAYDADLVLAVKRERRGRLWYERQRRQQGEWA